MDTDPANLTQIPMINGHRHQAACCASRLESRANSRGRVLFSAATTQMQCATVAKVSRGNFLKSQAPIAT